jgi:hypothetical protein
MSDSNVDDMFKKRLMHDRCHSLQRSCWTMSTMIDPTVPKQSCYNTLTIMKSSAIIAGPTAHTQSPILRRICDLLPAARAAAPAGDAAVAVCSGMKWQMAWMQVLGNRSLRGKGGARDYTAAPTWEERLFTPVLVLSWPGLVGWG